MLIYTCNRCCQDKYDRSDVTWEEFISLFESKRVRTAVTILEFLALAPDAQNYIKDVGGFVGGELAGGKRSRSTIISRSILTLDIDSAPKGFRVDIPRLFGDVAGLVYSTHKHTPEKPRLRVVMPLDRSVDPVEYEAIAGRPLRR